MLDKMMAYEQRRGVKVRILSSVDYDSSTGVLRVLTKIEHQTYVREAKKQK